MTQYKRVKQSFFQKKGKIFFFISIISFYSFAFINLALMVLNGFTDRRVALFLMSIWFAFFTMNLVRNHYKREGEKVFWHNWTIFSLSKKKQIPIEKENITEQKQASENSDQKFGT